MGPLSSVMLLWLTTRLPVGKHTQVTSLYKSWGGQWNLGNLWLPKLYRWKVIFIFGECNPTQECLCSCNSARAKVKICSACDLLPLLTTVTQLHNLFQLRLPSKKKKQLVSDMFNSKWSKKWPCRNLFLWQPLHPSFQMSTDLNQPLLPRWKESSLLGDVSYGCSTGALRSYAPHESCSFNLSPA